MPRFLAFLAVLSLPLLAAAQSNVIQGVDGSGVKRTIRTDSSGNLTPASAGTLGVFDGVAVTNAVGGTIIGGLTGRRTVVLQNLGPNPIYCGVSAAGTAPTTTTGIKISPEVLFFYDIASGLILKCVAETAAQVSPANTRYQEVG
jgi:hypothetical protein